jgi:hypothetical protein
MSGRKRNLLIGFEQCKLQPGTSPLCAVRGLCAAIVIARHPQQMLAIRCHFERNTSRSWSFPFAVSDRRRELSARGRHAAAIRLCHINPSLAEAANHVQSSPFEPHPPDCPRWLWPAQSGRPGPVRGACARESWPRNQRGGDKVSSRQ